MRRTERGFTLIEVLLSVGMLGLLAGISLPIYLSFTNRNDLDLAAQSVAETLRRAQLYSRANNGDTQWGVEVQPGAVTLFKGSSFGSRDTSYDEPANVAESITASGLGGEVLFAKTTGAPSAAGTITLTGNNETRTVTLNAEGMVSY